MNIIKLIIKGILYKTEDKKNNIPPATRLKVNLANLFGKNKAWLTAGNDIHHRAGESNRGPLTSPKNTKGPSFFFKTENFNTYMITHNPFPLLDPHLVMLVLDLSILEPPGRSLWPTEPLGWMRRRKPSCRHGMQKCAIHLVGSIVERML